MTPHAPAQSFPHFLFTRQEDAKRACRWVEAFRYSVPCGDSKMLSPKIFTLDGWSIRQQSETKVLAEMDFIHFIEEVRAHGVMVFFAESGLAEENLAEISVWEAIQRGHCGHLFRRCGHTKHDFASTSAPRDPLQGRISALAPDVWVEFQQVLLSASVSCANLMQADVVSRSFRQPATVTARPIAANENASSLSAGGIHVQIFCDDIREEEEPRHNAARSAERSSATDSLQNVMQRPRHATRICTYTDSPHRLEIWHTNAHGVDSATSSP